MAAATNPTIADALLDALVKATRLPTCERAVVVGVAPALMKRLKPIRQKVVFAASDAREHADATAAGFACVTVPAMTGPPTDRLKAALVAAMSAAAVKHDERIVCAIAREDGAVELLTHIEARDLASERSSLQVGALKTPIAAPLLEILVDLALRIGREGYEGRPIGTLIVVGHSTRVLEQSTPLTMNPFQGYSEQERNLFDHQVRSAVRGFAMLDGAFVVREDGVVLAAGRHIRVSSVPTDLPLGYGARHVAAAAVTLQTEAVCICVSQSSGKVRVFDQGRIVLELDPGDRRGTHERPPNPSGKRARLHVSDGSWRKRRSRLT